jgi:hypothetical protein
VIAKCPESLSTPKYALEPSVTALSVRLSSIAPSAVLLCCTPAFALGRVVSYEELSFSNVTSLQTCGEWRLGGELGYFRVLHAQLYGGTMLFVDMVANTARDPYRAIRRGFSVQELNNDHLWNELLEVHCKPLELNRIAVSGRGISSEREYEFTFRLEIDGTAGHYSYTEVATRGD